MTQWTVNGGQHVCLLAYPQVKERTTDTKGLHTEVAQMMRHAWESGKPGGLGHDVVETQSGSAVLDMFPLCCYWCETSCTALLPSPTSHQPVQPRPPE